MSFDEIVNEIIQIRFKSGQRASARRWVNLRYQSIWAYADWPWKRQGPVGLIVVQGNANPQLPPGFQRPVLVFDEAGNELEWMEPDEFDRIHRYGQVNQSKGRPASFKWVDNTIALGPTPDSNYNFGLVYDRKPTYMANGATPTSGPMVNGTDVPIWDEQYHYILVTGGIATGLRLENDPTYPQMEDDFSGQLNSMQDYYLPTAAGAGHLQFGNNWDAY